MENKNVLEKLTPEQEEECEVVAKEYLYALTHPKRISKKAIKNWFEIAYKLYDLKMPERLEIVDSPHQALKLASELTGEKQTEMDWCGVGDGGWVSFYDYFHRIKVLSDDEAREVLALREFSRCCFDSVLLDECAIAVRRPKVLKLDDEGQLHCTTGPCIEWHDGNKDYAFHGIWIPERFVAAPKSFTREEYLAITNTEERRALSEIAGWKWVKELLEAKSVDTWTDPVTKLRYELLRGSDGTQLLEKLSPKLKNGKQPSYLEPVHESLRTAQAARKWQATRLSVEECEKDPVLVYSVEA